MMDSSARKRRGEGRDGIAARAMAPEQTGSAWRRARHGGRTRGCGTSQFSAGQRDQADCGARVRPGAMRDSDKARSRLGLAPGTL